MRGRITRWLAVVAVLAFAPRPARAGDAEDDVVAPLPWRAGEDTVFLRRIVEAATGKPVAGATVKLICEVPHPEPGFGTPAAVGTSAPDGWVRIAKKDIDRKVADVFGEPSWAYVEAPGLRPDADMNEFLSGRDGRADWPLGPATTLRLALRDPLDRPVAGALIGWLLGCGHTPDVREARSGPDGVAVLENVGAGGGFGQIWPVADGLRAPGGYLTDDAWAPWERPRLARLDWAMTVEGTVLAHDGKPAAGVAVGFPSCHRGPWTHTDAEGRFRLVGCEARVGDEIQVEVGEYAVGPASAPRMGFVTAMTFPAPPPGHRAVVRLPAAGEEPDAEPAEARLVVEADRDGWPEARARAPIEVVAVRVADGWTTSGPVGPQGVALLDVRPGDYVVEALGERERGSIVYSRAQAAVSVPKSGGAYVRAVMPAPVVARLDIAWPTAEPFLDEVALVSEGATTVIPHTTQAGNSVDALLPADGPVTLRVRQGSRRLLSPVDRSRLAPDGSTREIHVTPFAPVEVRARFVNAGDRAVAGWLSELHPDESAVAESAPECPASTTPSLSTLSGDSLVLVAWPEDETRFQPSIVEVPHAASPDGKPLDLGAIRLAPRSYALRVEGSDGKPVENARVLVTRGDRSDDLSTGDGPRAGLVFDPWYAPGLLVDGALVRVWTRSSRKEMGGEEQVEVPFTRRLEGSGPWTIRAPAGDMTVEVIDESGAPVATASLALDGVTDAAKSPRFRVVGLEAGSHEAVVEAPGKTPRRLRFTLGAGEKKTWNARLRTESVRTESGR